MDFKNLIFISGKGGTGKTTFALLLARHLVGLGKKTLLVELANRSSCRPMAELPNIASYLPETTPFGFDLSLLKGRDCLVEYISSFVKVEKLTQQFFESSIIKALVDVAPGLNDLAVLGKLTSHLRSHGPSFQYDHIVVDAHSTGSFLSLLKAPQLLGASVSRGPLHTQTASIQKVLKDKSQVQYFFLGLFEELPVDELYETLQQFQDHDPGQLAVVLNKYLPIQQVKIPDPAWHSYLESKLEQQKIQKERVLQFGFESRALDFLLEPLSQRLKNQPGDLLRKL